MMISHGRRPCRNGRIVQGWAVTGLGLLRLPVQSKWQNHFQEHKTLFVIIAVGLVLLELEIFALAALKSGRETHLQVMDHQGNVLYVAKGNQLDDRSRAAFEKTFGPLSDYRVNLITQERRFPFRAWLAAAVGMPIAGVLLFGFFVRAFESLFLSTGDRKSTAVGDPQPDDRFSSVLARISRLNIFAMGALVLLFVVSLYAVPFMLEELGRFSAETISKYKWVFISALGVFVGVGVWIIYLRYLLARKAIESQAEVEKFRIQIEMSGNLKPVGQLEAPENTDRLLSDNGAEPELPDGNQQEHPPESTIVSENSASHAKS
jgi:hypothetical protein